MASNQANNGEGEENPRCPYCGRVLADESVYAVADGRDVKYACNGDGCAATAWTAHGWEKEQQPGSMLAAYL